MLVLSRKIQQTVEIPELGISIRVMSLGRSRVQLGITAPSEVLVMRGEKPFSRGPGVGGPEAGGSATVADRGSDRAALPMARERPGVYTISDAWADRRSRSIDVYGVTADVLNSATA